MTKDFTAYLSLRFQLWIKPRMYVFISKQFSVIVTEDECVLYYVEFIVSIKNLIASLAEV